MRTGRFSKWGVMAALATALLTSGCSVGTVDAGFEGVKVRKPWFFGESGVDQKTYDTGTHFMALTTDMVAYDVRPLRVEETFDDAATSDRTPVDFSAFVNLQINKGQAWLLHDRFGSDWYNKNVQPEFQGMIRDFARNSPLTSLTTDTKVTDNGEDVIAEQLRLHFSAIGLPVTVNAVVIGAVSPPPEVLKETSNTAAQEQRKRTEGARKDAEDSRLAAEEAKAAADRAYATRFGMNADQYLQYRALENQREMIELVKDRPNVNVILSAGGAGAAPVPMFDVGK